MFPNVLVFRFQLTFQYFLALSLTLCLFCFELLFLICYDVNTNTSKGSGTIWLYGSLNVWILQCVFNWTEKKRKKETDLCNHSFCLLFYFFIWKINQRNHHGFIFVLIHVCDLSLKSVSCTHKWKMYSTHIQRRSRDVGCFGIGARLIHSANDDNCWSLLRFQISWTPL